MDLLKYFMFLQRVLPSDLSGCTFRETLLAAPPWARHSETDVAKAAAVKVSSTYCPWCLFILALHVHVLYCTADAEWCTTLSMFLRLQLIYMLKICSD